jgi:hypothetical protein
MDSSPDRPKLLNPRNRFFFVVSFIKLMFKKCGSAHPQPSLEPTPAEPPQIGGLEWNLVCEIAQFWITKCKDNPDLVFLIQDRMGNLRLNWVRRAESVHLQSFVLAATDFYDELGWLPLTLNSEKEEQDPSPFQTAIAKALHSVGAELIRNTTWDASVQRATSIERTQEILNTPKILRFGRSGITLDGKLLRKQEVALLSN